MKQFHIVVKKGVERVLIVSENVVIGEMTRAATNAFDAEVPDGVSAVTLVTLGEKGSFSSNWRDLVSEDSKTIIINDIPKKMRFCIIDCSPNAHINGSRVAVVPGPISAQDYRVRLGLTNADLLSRGINPQANVFLLSCDAVGARDSTKNSFDLFKVSMYGFVEEHTILV
jgi:hypothetical protein